MAGKTALAPYLDLRAIHAEKAERCKKSFAYFLRQAWHVIEPSRPLIWGMHTDACAQHLQAIGDGILHRLVVNIAPGHGKSSIFSVAFPAWVWTRNPHERFLCASYAMDLAIRDNRNCRMLIESEWYQSLFSDVFQMSGDQNVKCLLGSTKIQTDHGEIAVKDIVEQKMDVRVLTFNHVKSIIENKYILAYEKHPGRPCVQVSCSNGATIICTLNHPFYVPGKGYVEARYLKSGDTVYARETGVRGVREGIPSSLSGSKDRQVLTACMQQGVPKTVDTRRGTSVSYLPTMREVQPVRQRRGKNTRLQVLQPCLPCEVVQPASRQSHHADVSGMRETIPSLSSPSAPEILFSRLLSCESPLDNTWDGTPALREGFWNDVPSDTQTRWQPVSALPGYIAVGSPSYRPRQTEQRRSQSDYSVPVVSSAGNTFPGQVGGVEATTIVAVIPDVSPSFVYNLEIEDNHNYFANGILTHNSFYENDRRGYRLATAVRGSGTGKRGTMLIIDDPNNGMAGAAEIEAVREWFGRTWQSRLNDQENGAMIITGQRLSEKDLTSHVLKIAGWEHCNLPTEYEPDRKSYTSIGWSDPRTVEGELLCPELVNEQTVKDLKQSLGSMNYAAQYQQSPMPSDGGIFKKQWFRYFTETPTAYILHKSSGTTSVLKSACWRFTVVDLAISSKQTADYTVIQTYDVTPENDLLLIDQIRDRLDNPEQVKALKMIHARLRPIFMKVESIAYQLALVQQLKRLAIPVKEYKPTRDKVSRASVAAILMENEKFFFREGDPYLLVLEPELLMFPLGAHDDQIDDLSAAGDELGMPRKIGGILTTNKSDDEDDKEEETDSYVEEEQFAWP